LKIKVNWLYFATASVVFFYATLRPSLAQGLISDNYNSNILVKKVAIYRTLDKYGSPLIGEVDAFLNACLSYGINCYLLPSISGVESTFGKFLLPDSHNPFGWGGGYLYFPSWQVSFLTVAKGLRENYIDKGLTSVEMIGPVYAPPSSTWAGKVLMFMRVFTQEESQIPTTLFEI